VLQNVLQNIAKFNLAAIKLMQITHEDGVQIITKENAVEDAYKYKMHVISGAVYIENQTKKFCEL
jgi:predicted negative regulator of RcsB-dependent stress response